MSSPIGRTGLARTTPRTPGATLTVGSAAAVSFFDDFLGDLVADQWNYTEGTDGATANAAILAGGVGGVLRITTGDAGTGLAADLACLSSELQWKASSGGLSATARLKISQITEAYLFFGFTDVASLEAPIVSAGSADTLTSTASDAVGFMFDTRMTTDKLWLVGVKGDTDAVAQNSAVAPVADTYITLRVDVSADGHASFYINNAEAGTILMDAVTPGTALAPVLCVSKTATATSMTADIDFVAISANRV